MDAPCKAVLRAAREPGYDGYKRKKGSKVHVAVDTLGNLLAVAVTPASEQERAQVEELAAQVQEATGQKRRTGLRGSGLHGPPSRRGCCPRTASSWRWSNSLPRSAALCCCPRAGSSSDPLPGWRVFRRLSRDYERLATTLAGLHWLAFACLLLGNLFRINRQS